MNLVIVGLYFVIVMMFHVSICCYHIHVYSGSYYCGFLIFEFMKLKDL